MKPIALLLAVLSITMTLAACQGGPAATTETASSASSLPVSYDGALSPVAQLAIGTLQLDDQPEAVTPEQAKELATLWRGYRSLANSDAAAPQEMKGIAQQLEEAMTDEQLAAIATMQLTSQDLITLMAERGVSLNKDSESSEGAATMAQALRQSGGASGGGPPAGGAMMGLGGGGGSGMPGADFGMPPVAAKATGDQGQQQSLVSARGGAGLPAALLDVLIESLESME